MKFEYDEDEPRGEPVAYIDDIYFIIRGEDEENNVVISEYGVAPYAEWQPEKADKLFYKGDKVTITL